MITTNYSLLFFLQFVIVNCCTSWQRQRQWQWWCLWWQYMRVRQFTESSVRNTHVKCEDFLYLLCSLALCTECNRIVSEQYTKLCLFLLSRYTHFGANLHHQRAASHYCVITVVRIKREEDLINNFVAEIHSAISHFDTIYFDFDFFLLEHIKRFIFCLVSFRLFFFFS